MQRLRIPTLAALITFASFLVLPPSASAASPHPCISSGQCAKAGWYVPGGNGKAWDNGTVSVTWVNSYVKFFPEGQVPQWITYFADYRNHGSQPQLFVCGPADDPRLAKEWFYRGGKEIGYVNAEKTSCSENPNLTFTLQPGEHRFLWATFHNVPWHGDRIALEWSIVQRGAHTEYREPYPATFQGLPEPMEPDTDPSTTTLWRDMTGCADAIAHRLWSPYCLALGLKELGLFIRIFYPLPAE